MIKRMMYWNGGFMSQEEMARRMMMMHWMPMPVYMIEPPPPPPHLIRPSVVRLLKVPPNSTDGEGVHVGAEGDDGGCAGADDGDEACTGEGGGVGHAEVVELGADEGAGLALLEAELRALVEAPPHGDEPLPLLRRGAEQLRRVGVGRGAIDGGDGGDGQGRGEGEEEEEEEVEGRVHGDLGVD
ncbi:hypothetical protein ACMD2_07988 [Ananas comosus]|uniref:Uncharacterized protein n=1 Tax=Ananas comosus TaxID=4615 RepID=A0A199VEG3_ANACO|nr:hypothetical protein ACMD2_07988 [Ananas comosus]